MHLVQILLPLAGRSGAKIPAERFAEVRRELLDLHGGVTAYTRAPAQGAWKDREGTVDRDEILVFEVMTEELDRARWERYRKTLEQRFEQDEIVVRVIDCERL